MNKLFVPIRIAILASKCSRLPIILRKELICKQSPSVLVSNFDRVYGRTMSQKNITSFFKITPKKVADVKEEKQKDVKEESPTNTPSSKIEKSPISNGKEKRFSKRQRLESSESETESPKVSTSPVSNDKNKKTKRQRIESSSSEAESHKSDAETEIKLEKTGAPRTYNSPKVNKRKVKEEKSPLTEKNEKETMKNYESSPRSSKAENIKDGKKKNLSPSHVTENNVKELEKNSSPSKGAEEKNKSPSPSCNKVKKKTQVIKSKNTMSMFLKKENGVSETKDENEEKGEGQIVPEAEYNPAKSKYHPITDACWVKDQPVPYLALAKTLEAIEATSARLKIVEILSNYLRSVIVLTPEDLLPSIYMCLNQLAPAYHSVELGIAETYLMKAVGACTGRTLAQVRCAARAAGDLGRVAEGARAAQRTMFAPPPLALRHVFRTLKEIAGMTGQASVNKKIAKIQTLYTACRHSEARYLIRSLEGKLRIGLAEQSVLQALAVAATRTPPRAPPGAADAPLDAAHGVAPDVFKARVDEQALVLKTTYCECPNYEAVVGALLAYGLAALPAHCRLAPGVPLKPMLAHPARGLHEVFNRFEGSEFTCEWKYDGERAQIHVPAVPAGEGGGEAAPDYARAAVFSRSQEDNTSKYPDIVRRLPSLLGGDVTSCVLDAEAVAYDAASKRILPFQVLSTRKRKGAAEASITVQVCVFVFDLLYLNGRALVREPLAERRRLLREHFKQVEGEWQFATSKDCSSMEEMQQFLEESVRGSCEGLMVKTLRGESARYDIARRSHNWLKVKKDYLEGAGDSVDLVVVGAWWGRGRRAGALGGFLLACRDAHSEELQTLCKLGTGFSDDQLQELTKTLQEHVIDAPRSYYRYDSVHTPDVWVEAACVWEVRCADLSLSPAHRAAIGLVDPNKGISLRFPRFVRVRSDKSPEQATSARQVADMYLAQDQVKNQAPRAAQAHDDFY